MAIEPRKPTKKMRPARKPRKAPRKFWKRSNPIAVRIEGLHIAYDFLKKPNAGDPRFGDVRVACLETLLEGLRHENDDVWPVAQELWEDLKKRGKI